MSTAPRDANVRALLVERKDRADVPSPHTRYSIFSDRSDSPSLYSHFDNTHNYHSDSPFPVPQVPRFHDQDAFNDNSSPRMHHQQLAREHSPLRQHHNHPENYHWRTFSPSKAGEEVTYGLQKLAPSARAVECVGLERMS